MPRTLYGLIFVSRSSGKSSVREGMIAVGKERNSKWDMGETVFLMERIIARREEANWSLCAGNVLGYYLPRMEVASRGD
jgi:hypothetical protein